MSRNHWFRLTPGRAEQRRRAGEKQDSPHPAGDPQDDAQEQARPEPRCAGVPQARGCLAARWRTACPGLRLTLCSRARAIRLLRAHRDGGIRGDIEISDTTQAVQLFSRTGGPLSDRRVSGLGPQGVRGVHPGRGRRQRDALVPDRTGGFAGLRGGGRPRDRGRHRHLLPRRGRWLRRLGAVAYARRLDHRGRQREGHAVRRRARRRTRSHGAHRPLQPAARAGRRLDRLRQRDGSPARRRRRRPLHGAHRRTRERPPGNRPQAAGPCHHRDARAGRVAARHGRHRRERRRGVPRRRRLRRHPDCRARREHRRTDRGATARAQHPHGGGPRPQSRPTPHGVASVAPERRGRRHPPARPDGPDRRGLALPGQRRLARPSAGQLHLERPAPRAGCGGRRAQRRLHLADQGDAAERHPSCPDRLGHLQGGPEARPARLHRQRLARPAGPRQLRPVVARGHGVGPPQPLAGQRQAAQAGGQRLADLQPDRGGWQSRRHHRGRPRRT